MRSSHYQVPNQLHTVSARYCSGLASRQSVVWTLHGWTEPDDSGAAHSVVQKREGCRNEKLRCVEAILLLAREPLSSRRMCQYANLADATEARTLVRELNELLDLHGRAFRVEEVAGGFQLLTRPKFATWLRRLASVPKELRLSAPALETLSVIAYRQPAGRAEIEAVRGVNCGEIVRQLLERDLVRIAGRSHELGRPYLYATTQRFLQLFGLKTLDDLPRSNQLRKQTPTHTSSRQSTDTIEIRNTAELRNTAEIGNKNDSPDRNEEEFEVTATIHAELSPEELRKPRTGGIPGVLPRASDDEDEVEVEADDDEEFDDLDDEDDDFDDDEDDDEEDDDEEEFDDEVDDEEGFEDEEWEEVDDEEDDEDDLEDDEEDDDWDDDDDDDEEEEEESSWE